MAKRDSKDNEVVQDAATGPEGNVVAETLGAGRVQQEEVSVANAEDTVVGASLDAQEGVGEVKVVLNPKRRAQAVSFPVYDNDGNLESLETFVEEKVHKVTKELAQSKDQNGVEFFVDAPEENR